MGRAKLLQRLSATGNDDGHLPLLLGKLARRLTVQACSVVDRGQRGAARPDRGERSPRGLLAGIGAARAHPPHGGTRRGRDVPGERACGRERDGHLLAGVQPDGRAVVRRGQRDRAGQGGRQAGRMPRGRARWLRVRGDGPGTGRRAGTGSRRPGSRRPGFRRPSPRWSARRRRGGAGPSHGIGRAGPAAGCVHRRVEQNDQVTTSPRQPQNHPAVSASTRARSRRRPRWPAGAARGRG